MKAFEDAYNKGDYEFCGGCYTDECNVVVNGGAAAGGFGPFKTPTEVAGFLKALREDMKATDMKFTVTEVTAENGHKDTWGSASMTGSCDASWVPVGDGWKISADMITAAPKPATLPESVVHAGKRA